jgi:hypothetical protein
MPTADGTVGISVDLGVVMSVQIDESWGHNQPPSIDHCGGVTGVQAADFGDLAVLNAEVGRYRGTRVPSTIVPPLINVSNCAIARSSF